MSTPQSRTRTETLADDVADAILSGEFAPGERLDEQSLARRFSVSRTPVREVLRQLASSGLIEIRPRRGAVVATVGPEQLDELFGAMAEIEATCARLSAVGMTQVERRRLQALHEAMGELVGHGDYVRYSEANQQFHGLIYAGAHNAVLAEFALGLRRRLSPYRRAQFRTEGRLARSFAEHDAVVTAVIAANAPDAHAAMLHHVALVEDAFESFASAHARTTG